MSKPALSIRHFEFFLTMVVSRNMAEAAESLGVSQAAVSKSLKSLERETGLTLFRNVNGRLQPTTDAEQLFPFAQKAKSHFDRAGLAARELRGGGTKSLNVGVAGPSMMSIMPKAMKLFRERWPDIHVDIVSYRTVTLLNRVAGSEIDIGLGTPPVQAFDARLLHLCNIKTVYESPLVAVMPKTHPLATRRSIRPADLANESMIALPEDSATTHLIAAAFQQAKIAINAPITISIALNGCGLIREGLGIGLMSRIVLPDTLFPDLVCVPFSPRITLRTCTYVPKLNTQAIMVERFEKCVIEATKNLDLGKP